MSVQASKPVVVDQAAQESDPPVLIETPLTANPALKKTANIAHIDIAALQAAGIPTPMGGRDRTIDEYRLIKRAILQNAATESEKRHRNLVMVTSTQPGEGKTFTAISLAMSVVAEAGKDVLLVDLDIGKQDVCRRLGIQTDTGLINLLTDSSVTPSQAFVQTDVPRLSILPAGVDSPLAHELIAGSEMRGFMQMLSHWYRRGIVIFDVAPVLGVPDASVLALNVGQIVLVVEANRTGRAAVAESISLLKGCQKISLLLNKVDASQLIDNYGSYYGQQYKVPNIGGPSIPERITNYVRHYLRRWSQPR